MITRGEAHPLAKLTEHAVREIRERYAAGGCTHLGIAAEYGVSKGLIGGVCLRNRWEHVK